MEENDEGALLEDHAPQAGQDKWGSYLTAGMTLAFVVALLVVIFTKIVH
jgi:hypothetical protein